VGPAGKLLDGIIASAFGPENMVRAGQGKEALTYALTNLVCCIPREEDGGKATEPPEEGIEACSDRLVQFVSLARPRLIVAVGAMARDYLEPGYRYSIKVPREVPRVDIKHPAAVLRMNYAIRGLETQRCVVTLANAIEELS
jgi:uracil-DNA glycosylase family 4